MQVATKAAIPPHGGKGNAGGLFTGICLNMGMTSAIPLGLGDSIWDKIRVKPGGSMTREARYGIVSGVTPEVVGDPAADCCEPPRTSAGNTKLCTFAVPYGSYSIKHDLPCITKIGALECCETAPMIIDGNPLGNDGLFANSMPGGGLAGDMMNLSSPGSKFMLEILVGMMRQWGPDIYTGDGSQIDANDSHVFGFQNLVNTGYQDLSNPAMPVPCPRADSYVIDYAGQPCVCEDPAAMLRALRNMAWTLKERARSFGLNPAMWTIHMDCQLFNQLAFAFACISSCGCGPQQAGKEMITLSGDRIDRLRNEMLNGNFLYIDGERFPVCCDPFLPVNRTDPTNYVSDIYFMPTVFGGNKTGMMLDYFNWNSPYGLGDSRLQAMMNTSNYDIWPNSGPFAGAFLIVHDSSNPKCQSKQVYFCPRPILLTPQIAGRITNVCYPPMYQHTPWDTNDPQFVNGGSTGREPAPIVLPTSGAKKVAEKVSAEEVAEGAAAAEAAEEAAAAKAAEEAAAAKAAEEAAAKATTAKKASK